MHHLLIVEADRVILNGLAACWAESESIRIEQ